MVGLLNMKECIPALKERLLACPEEEYRIQERAYRYALARLGDKEQRQYILDNFMDIDLFYREDFIYFKDDEMIWKYIETNYFSDTPAYSEFSTPIPTSLATINNIYPYVKNVPKDVEYPSVDTFEKLSDWSKIFYQWLMTNKENIKFDYDGEKDWSFWK
jgi:hypothetical protein